jgi:ubiquitin-protein ligase
MARKRLKNEINELQSMINQDNSIRNFIVDENNLFEWKLTVFVADKKSYDIQIKFPSIYLYY